MASQRHRVGKALHPMAHARLMYLGYFSALGAFLPFVSLYYERVGLNGVQIGTLFALPLVVGSATTLVWGGIADARRMHRTILCAALLLTPIGVFMISRVHEFPLLVVVVAAQAISGAPINPLIESAALEAASAAQDSYGKLRVWGTIGWIGSSLLVGRLIQTSGILWLFYGYVFLMGCTFVVSLFQSPRIRVLSSAWGAHWRQLLERRAFWVSMLGLFLLAVTIGAGNYFLSLYLDGLGASEGVIGLAWALAAVTEVPMMAYSGSLLRRMGHRGLLSIGFAVYALRWLIYSFVGTPALVLPVQLLQGISFAAFQVGGVTYVFERMPEGMSTTGQALFTTLAYSLAPIAGALLGGVFYDTLGLMSMFRVLFVLAIVGMVVFLIGNKREQELAARAAEAGLGSSVSSTRGE